MGTKWFRNYGLLGKLVAKSSISHNSWQYFGETLQGPSEKAKTLNLRVGKSLALNARFLGYALWDLSKDFYCYEEIL